ncbi:MAG: hypothetical protein QNJ12_15830 [Ilumatobacter sp.]|uniref:hypothetical protein n=1 Tax=Ilumatobacter sp. TaxID=1967498 RepID=UPI002627E16A|nr:hypothetical protein [Ilumatobacter sp.]MDJ0770268.1 hypothetical protein [Ilumatobacter sp.]
MSAVLEGWETMTGGTAPTTAAHGATGPVVEFCGEQTPVRHEPFTIGRDADLVIEDDNRFLHRQFLSLSSQQGIWLLANVGGQLTATVSDLDGRLEAFLAPGAVLPLVFHETLVRFTAGPTTYELTIRLADPSFMTSQIDENESGDTTIGRVVMTPDQMRLILALAEPALRGGGRAGTSLPSSNDAAQRLGWTSTKFNRKLDNVCQKLAAQGVRGLHGEPGRLASNRRARLVEYALAVRLITRDDLALIDTPAAGSEADDSIDDSIDDVDRRG